MAETMELEKWAAECMMRLPDLTEEPGKLDLNRSTLPTPTDCSTSGLTVHKVTRGYNSHYFVDSVAWVAEKPVLGALGLLILSAILHEGWDDVRVVLTNGDTEIREIRIDRDRLRYDSSFPKLRVTADQLIYRPVARDCHPWYHHLRVPAGGLPRMRLTNASGVVATDKDRENRDVLWGFGHLAGSARFAQLLLDLSRPSSTLEEVQLEGELGFRGVGPGSAELSIYLPGSFGWDNDWA